MPHSTPYPFSSLGARNNILSWNSSPFPFPLSLCFSSLSTESCERSLLLRSVKRESGAWSAPPCSSICSWFCDLRQVSRAKRGKPPPPATPAPALSRLLHLLQQTPTCPLYPVPSPPSSLPLHSALIRAGGARRGEAGRGGARRGSKQGAATSVFTHLVALALALALALAPASRVTC